MASWVENLRLATQQSLDARHGVILSGNPKPGDCMCLSCTKDRALLKLLPVYEAGLLYARFAGSWDPVQVSLDAAEKELDKP